MTVGIDDPLRRQFDSLVEQVLPEVRQYTSGLCRGDSYLAEDLIMEGWCRVLHKFPTLGDIKPIPFKVYFQRTIANLLKEQRADKDNQHSSLDFLHESGFEVSVPEYDPGAGLINDVVAEALMDLTREEKAAILFASQGYEPSAAPHTLGITIIEYLATFERAQHKMVDQLDGWAEESRVKKEPVVKKHKPYRGRRRRVEAAWAWDWLTAEEIASRLDMDTEWVTDALSDRGFQPVMRMSPLKVAAPHYPPESLTTLAKLLVGQSTEEVGDWLNMQDLYVALRRSRLWILNRLERMGVRPEKRRDSRGQITDHYPPSVLEELRVMSELYPAAEDWLTINQIVEQVLKERTWVVAWLAEIGVEGESRRIPGSGKVALHYPPQIVSQLLERAAEHKPAEPGWLTETALVKDVGRSHNWVKKRLPRYNHLTRKMTDSQGVPRIHFPPEVAEALKLDRHDDQRGRRGKKEFWHYWEAAKASSEA